MHKSRFLCVNIDVVDYWVVRSHKVANFMNLHVILDLRCFGSKLALIFGIMQGRFGKKTPHFDLIESKTCIRHACLESKDFYVVI